MTIFVNDRNEIHAVGSSTDETLTPVKVTDGTFDSWSRAKICCYCAEIKDGIVTSYYPYVNTLIIEQLDRLSKVDEVQAEDITNAEIAICDSYEYTDSQITDTQMALTEVYEMIVDLSNMLS